MAMGQQVCRLQIYLANCSNRDCLPLGIGEDMNAVAKQELNERVRSRNLPAHLKAAILFGLMLGFCSVFHMQKMAGIFAIVFYFAYLIWVLIKRPLFYVKYFAFIAFASMNVIGCFAAEYFELYLTELRTYSGFVGSLPLLVLSRWLIFPILAAVDFVIPKHFWTSVRLHPTSVIVLNWLSLGYFMLAAMAFLWALPHPAFLLGIDKFSYIEQYISGQSIANIVKFLPQLSIVPLLATRFGNRKLGSVGILTYLLYLLWTGNRFGEYFNIFALLLLVYYSKFAQYSTRKLKKVVWATVLIFGLLVFGATVVRGFTTDRLNTEYKGTEYLASRMAQQGQLWWRTYTLVSHGNVVPRSFSSELREQVNSSTVFSDNLGSTHAIYGIMYLTAPRYVVDNALKQGVPYAEAGYAASYYYFGARGTILFSLVIAVLAGLITNGLLWSMNTISVLSTIMFIRLLGGVRGFMASFEFVELIKPTTLVIYCLILVILVTAIGHKRKLPDENVVQR